MDNQLIPITASTSGELAVSARDLHRFLNVGRDFTNWCKQMFEYGFEAEKDFSPILAKSSGGRPKSDYALTLDTAKEISMLQRSEKGRQARRYFIQAEKELRQLHSSITEAPKGTYSKFREEGTYIDAYHIPYTSANLEGKVVRMITIGDLTWHSINDINNAIGSRTDATQTAKMLNRSGNKMAAKILLFGNTQPAWFCTQTGMNLIIASSRVLKAQRQHQAESTTPDAPEFPFNFLNTKASGNQN